MGTNSRVIYASDDDEEDDVSNAYQQSRESVSSYHDTTPPIVEVEDLHEASGEQLNEAMHKAHAGLFTDTQSINITDQTGYIDLDSITPLSGMKRNRTTMEQLSSERTTYSTKSCKIDFPHTNFDTDDHADDNDDYLSPNKKRKRAKSASRLVSSQLSEPKASSNKLSGSAKTACTSSVETHCVGLNVLSSEGFKTQTTVPFSEGTPALSPTRNASPMVLIPPVPLFPSPVAREPESSAALREQIDGIDDWLQQDIAQGLAAQRETSFTNSGSALPGTDPASIRFPAKAQQVQETTGSTIDPQDLVLSIAPENEFTNPRILFESFNASRAQSGKSVDKRPTRRSAAPQAEPEATPPASLRQSNTQSDRPDFAEQDPSLLPPEMYKPRPSKSRGRRATADVSDFPSSLKLEEPKKKPDRRSRTAGDAMPPIEILEDEDEPPRPTKKAKRKRNEEEQTHDEAKTLNGSCTGDQDAGYEDKLKTDVKARQSTVKSGDSLDEQETISFEPARAPKKKRGRPKKIVKQEKQAAFEAAQSIVADAAILEASWKAENADEGELPSATKSKKRGRPPKAKVAVLMPDDESEDELAGHAQTIGSASEILNDTNDSVVIAGQQQDGEEQLVKQTGKRGRKPKAKEPVEATPEGIDSDRPGQVEEQVESEAPNNEVASTRSPLEEKADSQNLDLLRSVITPSSKKQTTPETPLKQQAGGIAAKSSSLTTGKAKVSYRVGLSKKSRIPPLLKVLKGR